MPNSFVMLSLFFWHLSVILLTIISSTISKDLSLRLNKLDTPLLDGDGAESVKAGDSGMVISWGENFMERPEDLLANSGQCSTGPSKKLAKRRRNDVFCDVEQIEEKKPPVQQQVNQGPGKSGSPEYEENKNWAPKWDILIYGQPEDLYCVEDDSQRVLVCALNMDWRNMKLPDGTPATFPTTIEWCSPCKFARTIITKLEKSRGNPYLCVN